MSYKSEQYDRETKDRLLAIPGNLILEAYGKGTPSEYSAYTKKGMFLSPFVSEKTPSCEISMKDGVSVFHCWSTDRSGNNLQLVAELEGCALNEAWGHLARLAPYAGVSASIGFTEALSSRDDAKIKIDSYGPVWHRNLWDYIASRGIDREIAALYCCEVKFHYAGSPSQGRWAIGFPNIKNGYTLRSAYRRDGELVNLKKSSSCAPTFIDMNGQWSMRKSSEVVMVFEGFFDFLSWMTLNRTKTPGCDVVVLNSLSQIKRSSEYIGSHRYINVCLDHDEKSKAGQKATQGIIDAFGADHVVADCSVYYMEYKDFNDMLMAKIGRGESEEQARSQVRSKSLV